MSVQTQPMAARARWRPQPLAIVVAAVLIVAIGVLVLYLVELAPAPTQPPTGIQQEHAKYDPILYGYGWVDQKAGIAHIPIQIAIDKLAQQGLPSRPATAQTAKDEGTSLPSYSSSGTVQEQRLH